MGHYAVAETVNDRGPNVKTRTRCTLLAGAVLLALTALGVGCSSGIAQKYDVKFGLKADMSDAAPDPNSVAMLGPENKGKQGLRRPAEEIMTTEGVDEALDDDMDDISPPTEATEKDKVKAESQGLTPEPPSKP